jgi:hypothetical protein
MGGIINIVKNMLQKINYEKIKMFKKGPLVLESFVTIGSFEYDCTQKTYKNVVSIHYQKN